MFVIGLTDSGYHLIGAIAGVQLAPTDISLSNYSVATTAGLNAAVGMLRATDPNGSDTHTFALVPGQGDNNNFDFGIFGTTIRCYDPAALGVGTYTIRVQATDSEGEPFQKVLTITVVLSTRFVSASPVQSPIGDIIVSPVVS